MPDLPGTSKDQFLAMVRQALGRNGAPPAQPYAPLEEILASKEVRDRQTLQRLQQERPRIIKELARVAALRGWNVHPASTNEAALDYVRDLAQAKGIQRVVRTEQDVFQSVPVEGPLAGLGTQLMVMSRGHPSSGSFPPDQADLGITGVDYAIAETGTAVILSRRGVSRLPSLMPPVHVALVRPQDVIESLDDLYLLRRLAYHKGQGNMGSYMSFITGPSRTADIEQTLVIGAHGPKEVHMVMLTQEQG